MTAWTTSDGTGVRNRGCTPASQRGSTPSRAIAYGTRAAVSTMPLFAPSVATMIATATSPAPARPSVTWAASDATSDEAAIFAGDRTYVNEAVTRQYSAIPIKVESTIERGRLRSGSFTSPPTYVISIQPSYAHSAATIATLPPGSTKPMTMSAASTPILISVSEFCVTVPGFTPRQFSTVRATMEAMATALIPAAPSGVKKPT